MDQEPAVVGVVLAGHLGDVILRSSVLRPIRQRFPLSRILMIGSPISRELFGDSPHVDQFVDSQDLYLGPFRKLTIPARRSIARRTRRYWAPSLELDLLICPSHLITPFAIDLLELVRSTNIVGFVGGPYRHGDGRPMPADPKWEKAITKPVRVSPDYLSSHLFVQIANLLGTIGCNISGADDLRVEINLRDDDRRAAKRLTASLRGMPYGVIFPGASAFRHIKMWPADRFADVVRILGRNGLRSWLICGARTEQDDCTRLAALIRASHANVEVAILYGQPIRHVAAVLEGARLVVGNDNGGMHLAVAMSRPAVSIVSGTLRKHFFPWGDQKRQRAVMHELDCWGCRYNCIHPRVMCIEGISSELVAAECLAILDTRQPHLD